MQTKTNNYYIMKPETQQSNTQQQQQQTGVGDISSSTSAGDGAQVKITQQQQQQRPSSATMKRNQLIGAIDQGTSSTRFLVFENGTGRLISSSQIEIKRIVPKEGWVEIDPIAIMDSVNLTIENVHQQLANEYELSDSLKCVGICNQRESAVVWDSKTGKPLYNVIVWMDNRTKDLVDDMIDSAPGRDFNSLKDKTGLPMSTYFSAFKLKWLIDNVQEVKVALKEQRLMFGTVDSWILWNLTGNHLTDVTNASRTFLMDIETLEWDKSLCKQFGVPHRILPKILASADDFGLIKQGPLKGLPITGVIGDQSAALFGHNCLQLGQTKATFGTGCFIMQNIGPGPLHGALKGTQREAKRGLITTVGFKLRDKPACYALEGSIKIAGAGLTWLRDNLQLIKDYDECDQLVNKTTNSAGVFFVPALGGLYAPYWDPNAAGLYIGLSQFSRREHLVRATFDAIAFQTNDILALMRGVTNGLMIDGGMCKSDNLCQILADITGYDIVRPSMCETSALGAAMVAGCGAGIWTYERMLAHSDTPYEYSSSSNQNHHYPHESLNYEERFSSLIQSKHALHEQHQQQQQQVGAAVKSDQLVGCVGVARHSDAGGGTGVNDDAGGGNLLQPPVMADELTSVRSTTGSDTEDEVGTSGEFTATASEEGSSQNELMLPQMTGVGIVSESEANLQNYCFESPSSGYGSADNFELTTTNSATSTADHMRRDSPISSSEETCTNNDAALQIENRRRHLLATERSHQQSLKETEDNLGGQMKRSSFMGQTFQVNLSNCLRNYICPPQIVSEEQHLDADEEEDDEGLSFYEEDEDCDNNNEMRGRQQQQANNENSNNQQQLNLSSSNESDNSSSSQQKQQQQQQQITKPVDVFQPYISLEHRTELVDTWRLAVGRSMQWTKVHHEEVRKIDYQRLASLPISCYLFLSLGMVALSGLVSAATGREFS